MISAQSHQKEGRECKGCGGAKQAPLIVDLSIGFTKGFNATLGVIEDDYIDFSLCTECGKDLVNAAGAIIAMNGGGLPKNNKKAKKK